MKRYSRATLWCFCLVVAAWLTIPTLIIIPVSLSDRASFSTPTGWSLQWYSNFFQDPRWLDALTNSLLIAIASATVATTVGTSAAIGLSRWSNTRGRALGLGALVSTQFLPIVVLAIGIYAVFLKLGLVGTFLGFVLAHSCLGIPLVVVTVTASLASFDSRLELAAASLGADGWSTARHVTLPLIAPGMLAGVLLSFMASFDEVGIAIFIKSSYLETLPTLMFSSMTRSTDPTIAAASTLVLLLTLTLIAVAALVLTNAQTHRRKARR